MLVWCRMSPAHLTGQQSSWPYACRACCLRPSCFKVQLLRPFAMNDPVLRTQITFSLVIFFWSVKKIYWINSGRLLSGLTYLHNFLLKCPVQKAFMSARCTESAVCILIWSVDFRGNGSPGTSPGMKPVCAPVCIWEAAVSDWCSDSATKAYCNTPVLF